MANVGDPLFPKYTLESQWRGYSLWLYNSPWAYLNQTVKEIRMAKKGKGKKGGGKGC